MNEKCQMTIALPEFPDSKASLVYFPCGKPAKYINPKPKMGIEYICGIHASSLNKMYKRTGQNIRCQPIGGSDANR